jgi:ParB family transcriptional regulator, chromosome partitioning protein
MHLELGQLELKYRRLRSLEPRQIRRLMTSLAEKKQQVPVLVVADSRPHTWVLIDGYARSQALKKLGKDKVWAVSTDVTEAQALLIRQCSNGRRSHALEDGWLIRELVDGHGYELTEVARDLGVSSSWVSRRLALVDVLPFAAQQAVQQGRFCAFGAMKYLVPLARANAEQCKTLLKSVGKTHLTSKQLEFLYQSWRMSDAIGRERIVNDPLSLLRLHREESTPCIQALSNHLRGLSKIARHAHGHVRKAAEHPWAPELQTVWQRAQSSFEGLRHAMQEAGYVRPGYTDSHSQTS